MNINNALEDLYSSLENNNDGIDLCIEQLKKALKDSGEKKVEIDPARLYQNNREGRKMLQSYCKRRGVVIKFKK